MSNLILIELTSLVTVLVGIGAWLRNRRSVVHIYFCLFACLVALWTAANGMVHSFAATAWGAFWGRITFFSGSLIALSFFLFVTVFPSPRPVTLLIGSLRTLWIVTGFIFSILSFTPLLLVRTATVDAALNVTYGPLHLPFAVYFLGCFITAIYLLNAKRRVLSGAERTHTRYLLVAVLLAALGASITNLLLPLALGTSRYGQFSPLFTLFLIGLIGHAIIRHRLMDIRVVIKRSAVYLAAFLAAGVTLLGLLLTSTLLFPDEHRFSTVTILWALTIAVLFHPLKVQIQRGFDRYLSREPYNYQRVVRETSRLLGGTIDLAELLSYVGNAVNDTLRPTAVAIYLFDDDEAHFRLVWWTSGARGFPGHVHLSDALMTRVVAEHAPIFLDEPIGAIATEQGRILADDLRSLGVQVVTPLIEEGSIVGFLALGAKPFDNPYFSDDADLLATLANQSAVAIRNAQTHQRVLQMNEELQKILSTIESGVIAVGAKSKITLFNRAAERLTGATAVAARGKPARELPAPLSTLIARTFADGQRSELEFSLPDGAGQLIPLVCATSPLLDPQGKLAGAVAVISDLSRLKELEQEKRRAERLASIEAIASGLVHEIRNPLVAIKTFSQLLPVRYQDADFRETFSRTAGREIRRIDELLTRFRTLASASSQPMEPVDVTGPIRHILELIRPQLEERRIRLRQVADGTPRPILGNASQLDQLFLNLCLNAVEAMEPGGELTLRVADLSEGGGTTLLVEISDTGSGIAEDLLPRIFDPFVTTKPHGTGLGLAICRGIADAHRARLGARNNVGRPGSTFTIEFPVPVPSPSPTVST